MGGFPFSQRLTVRRGLCGLPRVRDWGTRDQCIFRPELFCISLILSHVFLWFFDLYFSETLIYISLILMLRSSQRGCKTGVLTAQDRCIFRPELFCFTPMVCIANAQLICENYSNTNPIQGTISSSWIALLCLAIFSILSQKEDIMILVALSFKI